jgi:hypothetical protein
LQISKNIEKKHLSISKHWIIFSRYNPDQYNAHSLRIGATTTAVMLGKTDDQIKQMGRWK